MNPALSRPSSAWAQPTSDQTWTILRLTAGVGTLAALTSAMAGAPRFTMPLMMSSAVTAGQMALLTLPPLVVALAAVGAALELEDVLAAVADGLDEGARMMFALAPILLYVGTTDTTALRLTELYFAALGTGALTAVAVATVRLGEREREAPHAARAVAWSWAFLTVVLAVPVGTLAFQATLTSAGARALWGA